MCFLARMVSNFSISPEYEQVRRKYCFYLDIQNQGLAQAISRKLEGMRLRQEVFLTPSVTHVVRERPRRERAEALRWPRRDCKRADAMLERVRTIQPHPPPPTDHHAYTELTVQKAICFLTNLYTKYFSTSKSTIRVFSKHFVKVEFLDKLCRPVFKEFDTWPTVSLEPNPPRKPKKSTSENKDQNSVNNNSKQHNNIGQKMTRKSRPRIKEKEEKEAKGGYCEMCNIDYIDAAAHTKSPHHLAYIKDHNNFLSLDTLISAGADVSTFLDRASQPVNGERRSLRKLCNGDVETKGKRSRRSQSPDSTVNGAESPRRNGALDDERKHNTRCSKRTSESLSEDRQYYKVVSTKLRSSGGFTKRKDSSPTVNGTNKPLVVKFRKVRRSELSVLSDEAEQFMFPKRASSTSSTSSDDEEKVVLTAKVKSPVQPAPTLERRRLARPLALKEESSEEDSWPEDKRKRKRRVPTATRRTRRTPIKALTPEKSPPAAEVLKPDPAAPTQQEQETELVSPLQEEPVERCMKWEGGKLKYTPAVEQLEFAFESVPQSEPWFETFKRQDEDKVVIKNVPLYFELYTKSPKLPYEIGQLPPLKPNCCPLSDLVKREEKPGPSRSYGTRGMKKQKIRKRTAAVIAMDSHPRKSPREHASTLAILGSAGLLRRRNADDAKSTASEDTVSDVNSNTKLDSVVSEVRETSERLQQFLSEVFDDASEYDISEEVIEGDPAVVTSTAPDVLSLVSECEDCNIIVNEIKDSAATRTRNMRGRMKKKNRTGWPSKRKQVKKSSRTNSAESTVKGDSSLDRSSVEMQSSVMPDEDTRDMISEDETNASESEVDTEKTLTPKRDDEKDKSDLRLDVKVLVQDKDKEKVQVRSKEDIEEESEKEDRCKKRKRSIQSVGNWLQPVVRVARVDPGAARRLRSAGRVRTNRYR